MCQRGSDGSSAGCLTAGSEQRRHSLRFDPNCRTGEGAFSFVELKEKERRKEGDENDGGGQQCSTGDSGCVQSEYRMDVWMDEQLLFWL